MRSIPEKTLEHWCSIHLSYRYRAKLRMWWPTEGEDISASEGPLAPGKRIWLELKTTEWNAGAQRHDLTIDLGQLAAYGQSSVPDFYVFPMPPWIGILADTPGPSWATGFDPSDFGYESHSGEKWFSQWLFVVPGSILRRIVAALPPKKTRNTKKTPSGKKSTTRKKKLRIAEVKNGKVNWLIPAPTDDELLLWRDFWKKMETCGDSGPFAAQFILPQSTTGLRTPPAPSAPSPRHPTPTPSSTTATTTWTALKTAALALKETGEASTYDSDSLLVWSPSDEVFVASKPGETYIGGDGFRWRRDVARSMVLLSVDALRISK